MKHQTLSSRKRIFWIDWAKAIGISLVVWGHFSPIARHEIFLFHMPFFFMISGLLYRQKGLMNELKGSVFSLVLPYLIYNFLYMSPLPFGGARDIKTVVNVLLGNQEQLCYVMVPLWFLVALFVMRIICSSPRIKMIYWGIISIFFSILLFGYLDIDQTSDYFQLKTAFFCIPFFAIGTYIKPLIKWCEHKKYMFVIFMGLFILSLLIGLWNAPDRDTNVFHCFFGNNLFLYYFSTIGICISLLVCISFCFKSIYSQIVEKISIGTLLILCLHLPIRWHIPQLINNDVIMSIINFVLVMIRCYFLILLAYRFFPIILGKRIKLNK